MKVLLLTAYEGANRTYEPGTVIDMPSKLALKLIDGGTASSVDVHAQAKAYDVGVPEAREEAGMPAQPERTERRPRRAR